MPENVCVSCKGDFNPDSLPLCVLCKRQFCKVDMPNHECMLLKYKMVFLVPQSLNMSIGKTASQVAHVASELTLSTFLFDRKFKILTEWREEGARMVVLAVRDLEELNYYVQKATDKGLEVIEYADGGITEVAPGTVTGAGIFPALAEDIDIVTGGLQPL